jgi:2-polyprenyl-3-methyl-5-hydroxy-6-metoxy-1,4-benzoquinol methylase
MRRENTPEILEQGNIPEELVRIAYRDLARIHRWLGDTRLIVNAIRRDPLPVHRVLDIGCGIGLVLKDLRQKTGTEVFGADIRPQLSHAASIPIVRADARYDRLPVADVAFCMHLVHHLCEGDVVKLIRNVGRYCRRFILLDSVRHPLPLTLFRIFLAPLVCSIDAKDGQKSIRRSYSPAELGRITAAALGNTGVFRLTVAPLYIRQIIDISYEPEELLVTSISDLDEHVDGQHDLLGSTCSPLFAGKTWLG